MFAHNREGNHRFTLRSRSIGGPLLIAVLLLFFGVSLLRLGFSGDWTTPGEDMVLAGLGLAMLIGSGLMGVLAPHVKTFEFDKANDRFSYEKKKLTGSQTTDCPLSEIRRIVISSHIKRTGSGKNGRSKTKTVFEYFLEFHNGGRILLGQRSRQGRVAGFMGESTPTGLRELSRFLDLEIKEYGLKDSLEAVSGAIRDVISSARKGRASGPESAGG